MSEDFTFLVTLFCTSDASLLKYAVPMKSEELNEVGDLDDAVNHFREHEQLWLSKLPAHVQSYPVVEVEWIETFTGACA